LPSDGERASQDLDAFALRDDAVEAKATSMPEDGGPVAGQKPRRGERGGAS
jgi:hypothetical protein